MSNFNPAPDSSRVSDLTPGQRSTLATIWATYGSMYFCRVNIGAAAPSIRAELGIDALQMGFIQGALKVGYALGQLINGQLAERFGAKRILLLGMTGSVLCCVLFASSVYLSSLSCLSGAVAILGKLWPHQPANAASLLLLIWLANGYFQAGGWPPCVKVMANWFAPWQRGRTMGLIGTSYQLGTSLTLYGAGVLIVAFDNDWRAAFLVPAGLLLLSAVHTAWRLEERPAAPGCTSVGARIPSERGRESFSGRSRPSSTLNKHVDDPKKTPDPFQGTRSYGYTPAIPADSETQRTVASHNSDRMSIARSLAVTLTNGRIWVLAIGLFGLDVVRFGFLDWVPTHLKEVQKIAIDAAGLKAAVLPLGGALGAILSGWVSDRLFGSRRAPVIVGSLLMVGVLTVTYQRVASAGGVATVACLGSIGIFLYAAQILLVGTAAQDFARLRTSAAAAGFVDFMGYTGAFGGDVVTGYLLKHYDWHAAIYFWAGAAFVAAAVVATLWNARSVDAEEESLSVER